VSSGPADRGYVGVVDVVADHLPLAVRRAPGRVEERSIVGVEELQCRRSGELAEPDRRAQRMLEGGRVPRSVATERAATTSAARIGCSVARVGVALAAGDSDTSGS